MSEQADSQETEPVRGLVILVGGADDAMRLAPANLGFRVVETDAVGAERRAAEADKAVIVVDASRDAEAARQLAADRAGRSAAMLLLLPEATALADIVDDPGEIAWLSRPFSTQTITALISHLLRDDRTRDSRSKASGAVRGRLPRPFTPNRLYDESRVFVAAALEAVRGGHSPDLARSRPLAEEVYTDLLHHNALVNRSLEPHEAFDLASHCVNVAIISGKIGLGLALSVEDELRVIQAGLIHDIGMARLEASLLSKPGALSEEERIELRRHPVYGAEIIESLGPRFAWLQRAVLQEHERARGQGYPIGLVASQIDPVAVILGVADVFEALVHPRSHRSPFTGLEALETLAGMQEEYFPTEVVAALVNEISAFPLDSHIQLSTGEIARVVATDSANLLRPTVDVLWDSAWVPLSDPVRIDLSERPDLTVARSLLDAELPLA